MAIKCCRNCVPPKRYPGCHDKCNKYLEEKAKWEEAKAKAKQLKKKGRSVVITKEPRPYKADDGRLFYYSVMWIF